MKSILLAALVALVPSAVSGQLRVVTWNTLDGPSSSSDADFRTVFSAMADDSVNGIARPIDVIALQEQTATSAANIATILNTLHGVNSYVAVVPSGQDNTDRVGFVYNGATVQLLQSSLVASGGTRPFARGRFRPVGYTSAAAEFYLYSLHLNASNAGTRGTETTTLRNNANALGSVNALFSGDYNMDASTEPAMLNLTDPGGSGRGFDPINRPGTWSNNAAFASIHTQSTRVTNLGDGGATGGVDDRFDLHLVTAPLLSGEGLSYLGPTAPGTVSTHSYRAFGNNGSVFNKAINDAANTFKPRSVLDALHRASDHLPVVLDLQVPAKMGVAVGAVPPKVIQGAVVTVPVTVSNVAAVSTPLGADELDFVVSGEGALVGSSSGSIRPQSPATKTLQLDTTAAGVRGGVVSVSASSPAAENATFRRDVSFRVLRPSVPSLRPDVELPALVFDVRPADDRPRESDPLPRLYNLADEATGSAMDIDAILAEGDTAALRLELKWPATLRPGESLELTPWVHPDAVGTFTTRYLIQVSDEDVPGERQRTLELVLRATVPEPGLLPAALIAVVALGRRSRR